MGRVPASTTEQRKAMWRSMSGPLSPQVRFLGNPFSCTPRYGLPGRGRRPSLLDPQATWALPLETEHWSLTMLREKLVEIGAKVVRHGRYVTLQMAEVAIPIPLFAEILRLINGLRPAPFPHWGQPFT